MQQCLPFIEQSEHDLAIVAFAIALDVLADGVIVDLAVLFLDVVQVVL